MEHTAVGLLNNLLELVKMINSINSIVVPVEVFEDQISKVNKIYNNLDDAGKSKLWTLISVNFENDPQIHMFLLSVLLKAVENDEVLECIAEILLKGKIDLNESIYAYLQISRYHFLHNGMEDRYQLRRRLHESILDRFKEKLDVQFSYRKLEERNADRIVVATAAILDISHAPTRQVMDVCYRLQNVLHKEVLLLIFPIENPNADELTWFLPMELNSSKDYVNQIYLINYKGEAIKSFQLPIRTESIDYFRQLIVKIYEFNPLFVLGLGSIFSIEDIMSEFTTVVSKEMSIHYPVSAAQILLRDQGVDPLIGKKELEYLTARGQMPLEYIVSVEFDDAAECLFRNQFDIAEDAFVLAIVGNRLDSEITPEYLEFLNELLDYDKRFVIAFIGKFHQINLHQNENHRVFYLGFQSDLSAAFQIVNLYLNPPRNGGGKSALIALYNGVPVVTFPECDVASNVGDAFICSDYPEMGKIIKRYITDEEFYSEQKRKGLELTHKEKREDVGLGEMIENITNLIRLMDSE